MKIKRRRRKKKKKKSLADQILTKKNAVIAVAAWLIPSPIQ